MNKYTKNKKILPLLALTLSISTLTACIGGDKTVVFTPYWATDINVAEKNISQSLEYSVTFDKSSGIVDYSVDYKNGSYKTELTTQTYGENNQLTYRYVTALQVDVEYTLGEEVYQSTDIVKTETIFHLTDNRLRPISSSKEIVATSPSYAVNAKDVKECYAITEYTISTLYNEGCTSGETTITTKDIEGEPFSKKEKFTIPEKYTYLDNEQLLFAISGVNPHVNSAPSFAVYSPFSKAMQTVDVKFSAVAGEDFTIDKDGESKEYTVQCFPVTIALNAKNPGATQNALYASYKNSPEFRNVLLELKTPISFGLGTLIYTLEKANFTK